MRLFGKRKREAVDGVLRTHERAVDRAIEEAKVRHWADGMRDGVMLTLDLVLGENSGRIPPHDFEELRYRGEMPEELRRYLAITRREAEEEAAEAAVPGLASRLPTAKRTEARDG